MSFSMAGGLNFKIPSNPNDSMILWFYGVGQSCGECEDLVRLHACRSTQRPRRHHYGSLASLVQRHHPVLMDMASARSWQWCIQRTIWQLPYIREFSAMASMGPFLNMHCICLRGSYYSSYPQCLFVWGRVCKYIEQPTQREVWAMGEAQEPWRPLHSELVKEEMLWIIWSKYHNYQTKPQTWQLCIWEGHRNFFPMKPQQPLLVHRENSHQKGEYSCCRTRKVSEKSPRMTHRNYSLLRESRISLALPQQVWSVAIWHCKLNSCSVTEPISSVLGISSFQLTEDLYKFCQKGFKIFSPWCQGL